MGTTTNYGWTTPTIGADADTWGSEINTTLGDIDAQVFLAAPKASPTFSGQITSTQADGTAPLVVASATQVANLNVTYLQAANWASPLAIGGTAAAAATFTTLTATNTVAMAAGKALVWNSDAGISRAGAASLLVGNGTNGDQTGTVAAAKFTTSSNANITSPSSGIMQVGTGTTTGAGGTLNAAGFNGTIGATTPATGSFTTVSTSGAVTISGSAATAPSAVTFNATTMTLDCSLSNVFTTTFTANVTSAPTVSNPVNGQTLNWFITQDGTGSRTMTWPSSFKWPGGVAGVLSTAANSVDLLVATYRSATSAWYASLAKGFA